MAKKNEKIKAQAEAEEMVSKSEAIFKKYKVTPQDLEANTKFGRASRTFEIDPDEVMDK